MTNTLINILRSMLQGKEVFILATKFSGDGLYSQCGMELQLTLEQYMVYKGQSIQLAAPISIGLQPLWHLPLLSI